MTVAQPTNTIALDEARGLLRTNSTVSTVSMSHGYIDLLQDRDVLGPHRGQQIFAGKVLPVIYERFWRPVISRLFFGLFGPGTAGERRLVLDGLDIAPGDRVIDVGCGTGNYTRHLAQQARNGLVVGVDASETMLSKAVSRGGENVAYMRGDACALPFGDGEFDAVCNVGVLHMMEDWQVALDELVRMLAPGGRLVVGTLCNRKESSRTRKAGGWVFGPDELTSHLRECGLSDIGQRTFRWGQFVSARRPGEGPVGR